MDANLEEFGERNPRTDERSWSDLWKEDKKAFFFTGKTGDYDEAEELYYQFQDIRMRVAEPGKDFIGQLGWAGMVAILGSQAVAGIMKVSPIIKQKILNKNSCPYYNTQTA